MFRFVPVASEIGAILDPKDLDPKETRSYGSILQTPVKRFKIGVLAVLSDSVGTTPKHQRGSRETVDAPPCLIAALHVQGCLAHKKHTTVGPYSSPVPRDLW